ncbi:MAG: helix-hairpin-helix domain-containing protein [Nitrospinota bacterium]|nr:helix-hairpin-helix domain-containing protein [Nitrospinota bacterium]
MPGIGKKRRLMLLKEFGSFENIQKAPLVELTSLPGITKSLAEKIQSLSK